MNGNLLMALRAEALATNLDKLDKHLSRIPDRRKQQMCIRDSIVTVKAEGHSRDLHSHLDQSICAPGCESTSGISKVQGGQRWITATGILDSL